MTTCSVSGKEIGPLDCMRCSSKNTDECVVLNANIPHICIVCVQPWGNLRHLKTIEDFVDDDMDWPQAYEAFHDKSNTFYLCRNCSALEWVMSLTRVRIEARNAKKV